MRELRKMVILSLAGALGLSGCATFHAADGVRKEASQALEQQPAPKSPPVVQTLNAPYLLGTPVKVEAPLPALMKTRVTMVTSRALTLREIAAQVTELTGLPVDVQPGVEEAAVPQNASGAQPPLPPLPQPAALPPMPVGGPGAPGTNALPGAPGSSAQTLTMRLDYHGPLSGLLDTVAARAGVWWRFQDGRVEIYRTETRTFSIPALAWATRTNGSIVSSAGMGGGTSGASPASGSMAGVSGGAAMSTSGVSAGVGSVSGSSTISSTSTVDVWQGIEKTAATVAGTGAQVAADAAVGAITVTGTPEQIRRVGQWVQNLSRQLSRQVAITVHVYNVHLKREQNYGLSLASVFSALSGKYGFSLQGVAPPVSSSGQAPFSLGASILSGAPGAWGQWSGSQAAVQALSTLGDVTQSFSNSVVTLNGQPAPVQVGRQISFIAASTATVSPNAGAMSGIVPGTITPGFTATFLPQIANGRILLGMNMIISSLIDISKADSGGSSIQTPNLESSSFQQSVILKSGETLLLTGFRQRSGKTVRSGTGDFYAPFPGGGAGAATEDQMIAITITARIL